MPTTTQNTIHFLYPTNPPTYSIPQPPIPSPLRPRNPPEPRRSTSSLASSPTTSKRPNTLQTNPHHASITPPKTTPHPSYLPLPTVNPTSGVPSRTFCFPTTFGGLTTTPSCPAAMQCPVGTTKRFAPMSTSIFDHPTYLPRSNRSAPANHPPSVATTA